MGAAILEAFAAAGATCIVNYLDDPAGANTNLLTSTNQGSDAVFSLNGIPVTQPGNVVNSVIPGVTFTIQDDATSTRTLYDGAGRAIETIDPKGMIIDTVYEGKSMAGLIDLVTSGDIDAGSNVLYAHLGGQPALNAYSALFR